MEDRNMKLQDRYLPIYMGPAESLFSPVVRTSLGKLASWANRATRLIWPPQFTPQKKASPEAVNASTRVQEHRNAVILYERWRKCISRISNTWPRNCQFISALGSTCWKFTPSQHGNYPTPYGFFEIVFAIIYISSKFDFSELLEVFLIEISNQLLCVNSSDARNGFYRLIWPIPYHTFCLVT